MENNFTKAFPKPISGLANQTLYLRPPPVPAWDPLVAAPHKAYEMQAQTNQQYPKAERGTRTAAVAEDTPRNFA